LKIASLPSNEDGRNPLDPLFVRAVEADSQLQSTMDGHPGVCSGDAIMQVLTGGLYPDQAILS
jgi:hypothetical protein